MSDLLPGRSYPLGATITPEGINFSVFSKNSTAVELLLFDRAEDGTPSRIIPLDPAVNKTFYYWHVCVPGLEAGQLYGYRVYGPFDPLQGHRFDGWKVLIDPYARAVAPGNYVREAAQQPGDNAAFAMKSVVVDPSAYDWEGDKPLHRPYAKTVIYEMHVGGFTKDPSSGVAPELRGTYAGLVEKIPYLQELGVTAVELMPVQQFDPYDTPSTLTNYWGYSPIALFAPHHAYSSRKDALGPVDEFRDMVKALHRAGIEVILDVVFNHTAEGNHLGPTLSMRGFENRGYYLLEDGHLDRFANYSGTGNTLNANHSIVRRLIRDCLRYWVDQMHVDGFRFDLASVMSRDERGIPQENPPILWSIESDPVLAGAKIIAEAWDAAGLYQVGSFVGYRWAEWNARFRDDVRAFVKGDTGLVRHLASRITASPDLYTKPGREPNLSINFVTAHDGFTLNDLVSYNEKHNLDNYEGNRDGHNHNLSWNCGAEGPTDDAGINALRARQRKNFLTLLLLSQGTPMFVMGDEVARTQRGNNNAYCQDNALNWLNWDDVARQGDLFRFVQHLIRFNLGHEVFQEERFWQPMPWEDDRQMHITWHGVHIGQPDWSDFSRTLAYSLQHPRSDEYLHVMINAYWEPVTFDLPALQTGRRWHRVIDTFQLAPHDILPVDEAPAVPGAHVAVEGRSIVVVEAR
ncbi:MAG: glycogen debranching protein GlgX [Bacteroidota bacterium]